jgi:hypothetical protein
MRGIRVSRSALTSVILMIAAGLLISQRSTV